MARFVSPAGSDSNEGTQQRPYRTIQHAIDQAREDRKRDRGLGVVLVEPGRYREQLTLYDGITVRRAYGAPALSIEVEKGTVRTVSQRVELVRSVAGRPLVTMRNATGVTISGFTLDGQNASGRAIDVDECRDVRIEDCAIWNHAAAIVSRSDNGAGTKEDPYRGEPGIPDSSSGGAVRVRRSRAVTMTGCYLANNRCDRKYSVPSPFEVGEDLKDVIVSGMTLKGDCVRRLLVKLAEVYHNGGGALFAENTTGVVIENSLFANNAGGRGGGVRLGNKTYGVIRNSHFTLNQAWVDGGGLAIWDYEREPNPKRDRIAITRCWFTGNTATDDGGGVYLTAKTVATVENCTFVGNASGSNGGGLRVTFGSEVDVKDCTFIANIANTDAAVNDEDNKDGGGAVAIQNSTVRIRHSSFRDNRVHGFAGGAVYCNTVKYDPVLESIGQTLLKDNFDTILKQKYRFTEAVLVIDDCQFAGNDASGKTCYGSGAPTVLLGLAAHAAVRRDCDLILEALEKARDEQKCDLKTGRGMTEGGAGGAIYVLEQADGYLPIRATITGSTFAGDTSAHHDTLLRSEIVAVNCRALTLSGLTMSLKPPTLYKLSLRNVTLLQSTVPGLTCAQGFLVATDPQMVATGSTCRAR